MECEPVADKIFYVRGFYARNGLHKDEWYTAYGDLRDRKSARLGQNDIGGFQIEMHIRRKGQNAEFFAADAEEIVPRLIDGGTRPDIVILDPPRAGSDEKTLAAICAAAPKRIVYVSCDSASLARDLRFINVNGYDITRAAAVDMFPHTAHVETVVLLSRVKD